MDGFRRWLRRSALVRGRDGALLLVVAAAAWIVVFGRIGYPSLLDPDEAHYAQLTREMIRSRSWFVPLLDGSPFIDKPVFFHWLQIGSVWLFGESEFALRLPSAVAGVALVLATRRLAATVFGVTGNLAALMFATLPFTFALANIALFDMVYSAFLFGAVAAITIAIVRGREGLQYVGYVLLVFAVMTKGPVALLLVMLWAGSAALVSRSAREGLRALQWPTGLLIVAVCASPWFVYMWTVFDGRFVRDYLLAGNLWYFTGPRVFSSRASDYTFYLRTFAGAFFPWSLVAAGYAIDRARQRFRERATAPVGETLLFVWVGVILLFFSAARFKLDWYIFPAAPACCVLGARGWRSLPQPDARIARAATIAIAGLLFVGGAMAAMALFRLNLGISRGAVVLPAALTAGGGIMLLQLFRQRFSPPPLAAPVAALLVAYAAVVVLGFPVLERSRPTAPVGRWVRRHTAPTASIGIYQLDDWRASIRYYSDRPITRLRDAGDVREFLEWHRDAYVLMLRSDFEALRAQDADLIEVSGRAAIVGRTGKYLRRQVWGTLVIVAHRDNPAAVTADGLDSEVDEHRR